MITKLLLEILEAQGVAVCPSCLREMQKGVCWCGEEEAAHNPTYENHFFVPWGCTCFYDQCEKRKGSNWQLLKIILRNLIA